jgi:predicted acyltransferase
MSVAYPWSTLARRESATHPTPALRLASRLTSLDVFRGLTIIGMLLVNDPGDASVVYAELRHSAWNGWTLADLVFPFFLFVVGITTQLSLTSRASRGVSNARLRRHVLARGGMLFAIGLLLNWFPFYQYGTIAGHDAPTFLDHVVARLEQVRVLGVLQRIGLAYIGAAFLTWRAPSRRVVAAIAALLVGYWLLLTVVPVPGEGMIGARLLDSPSRTLAAWVDRVTLNWTQWGLGNHIWESSVVYDPEGILSTIPAIATAMIGVLVGRWVELSRSLGERLSGLFAAGALLTVAGLLWSGLFPINKSLWTSSYVLFTGGVACTTLATISWLIDVRRWRRWTEPFIVFGLNPIAAYVGAELTAMLVGSTIKLRVSGRLQSGRELIDERVFGSWLEPRSASLAYAVAFVLLWYFILRPWHRRGIILKV